MTAFPACPGKRSPRRPGDTELSRIANLASGGVQQSPSGTSAKFVFKAFRKRPATSETDYVDSVRELLESLDSSTLPDLQRAFTDRLTAAPSRLLSGTK